MKKYVLNLFAADDGKAVFTTSVVRPDKASGTLMYVADTMSAEILGQTLLGLMVALRIEGVVSDSNEVPDATAERVIHPGPPA
jgi:hypothetical protein